MSRTHTLPSKRSQKCLTCGNVWRMDTQQMERVRSGFLSRWKFSLMLATTLPLAWLAGVKIRELTPELCRTSIRYRWLNKNPFRSTFWAALGMAAEMASGAIVLMYTAGQKPSVSTLVRQSSAIFHSKAVGTTTFTCTSGGAIRAAIEETLRTGEGVEVECPIEGVDENGKAVATFTFVWSIKVRS